MISKFDPLDKLTSGNTENAIEDIKYCYKRQSRLMFRFTVDIFDFDAYQNK